jgi:mono/diheme cytochrome c family protein
MNALRLTAALLTLAVLLASATRADDPPATARKLDYNRDVRPILADNCFKCHGPDEKQRKAKMRLDTQDGLLALDKKELVARVTSHEADKVMPPVKSGKTLTAEQIATLKTWIDQGASWSGHWAFTVPVRTAVPVIRDPKVVIHNFIDNFVADRLIREGLTQSPPGDKVTLIRRLTLDLTGLPPTPEEVDAFLKDNSPEAYEKVVDRLLASPRFGERMAWRWLEAARYADTNGYQTDAGRDMWRWRDWVIEAYNKNLPFDQFTIEQLAGDMLNGTLDQKIATGFNRNHRGNSEGGIVPEEYAAEYVADRVETTATVWLGLTFTCCRCHDHKFDPFPQKDFYRLFAYFNNVPEKGRAVKFGNSPPVIKAPTREQQKQLAELDERLKEADLRVAEMRSAVAAAQRQWEKTVDPAKLPAWTPVRGLVESPLKKPAALDGKEFVTAGDVGNFGFDDRFTLACQINPRKPDGTILSRGVDEARGEGYTVALVGGKVQVHLTKRWLDDALRIETIDAVPLKQWSHIAVSYDASRLAAGTRIYIDGTEVKTRVLLDELNQTFATKEPLRVGGGAGSRFEGMIDDVKLYPRELHPTAVPLVAVAETPAEILRLHITKRTRHQHEKLRAYFVEVAAPKDVRDAHETQRTLHEERRKLWDSIPTVMVMEEMATPRDTHILTRGEYDKKGEKVTPGVPALLQRTGPVPVPGRLQNRLDLARWIVWLDNPLTARVAVNRAWQMHFGVGLVKTAEDFGTQGAFPTHPELLDWLAREFMVPTANPDRKVGGEDRKVGGGAGNHPGTGVPGSPTQWDVKRLHKLIVMSATYRQSSRVTKEHLARDPENKLLARYPRIRLSSEMLRDQALFASGLLVEKLGGPSVKPYQPAGLWDELSGTGDYTPDKGANLYRRSLYTYWKRTSPPPVMAAFDAAGRETCWVRESRTNTPLQALALLNETAFVEAARVLAARVMREAKTPDERLTRAFRLVAARTPTARELKVIRENFDFQLAEFRKNPPGIQKLMAIGEARPDGNLDPAELAAYTAVCNLLLNLDEVVTKE